jgi:hypothetical protein
MTMGGPVRRARRGALVDLALGTAVTAAALVNRGQSEPIQTVTNVVGSLPLFASLILHLPLAAVVFFTYWAGVGAIFGWLAGARRQLRHEGIALVAVVLLALHGSAEQRLAAGIEVAVQAVVGAAVTIGR